MIIVLFQLKRITYTELTVNVWYNEIKKLKIKSVCIAMEKTKKQKGYIDYADFYSHYRKLNRYETPTISAPEEI